VQVPGEVLEKFAATLLEAAGVDPAEASRLAVILVWADAVGRTEQGLQRLPILIERFERGLIRSPADGVWSESGATAHLDAGDGFGHLAADRAVDRVIQLASQYSMGLVTVAGSNYFGAAGFYAARIADAGLVGLVVSNSFPKVNAPGGTGPVLGTNPLAFAAPLNDGAPLLVDLATSTLAGSDVRRRAGAGETLEQESLQHFGGSKGFGIALLVEVLAGVLAGAAMGDELGSLYSSWDQSGRNGHALLAFAPRPGIDLLSRMATLADLVAASGGRLPGAERWKILADSRRDGVSLGERRVAPLRTLAERLGVEVPMSMRSES